MAKQQWPATVKNAWKAVAITGSTSESDNVPIPLEIGQGQVAVLLALQYSLTNAHNTDKARLQLWLDKRSQPGERPSGWIGTVGAWQHDTNVIDYAHGYLAALTSDAAYKVYPYPVILIRSPSLIYRAKAGSISCEFALGLWYVLQNITDKEMTELMVKDHA